MRRPDRSERIRRPEGCFIALRVYNELAQNTVFLSGGLGCGLQDVFFRYIVDDLASDHRVVTWDYRGHGESSEADGPGAYSLSALAKDLAALQEVVGASTAAHMGFGAGAMVVLEHHRRAPESVAALVLLQGGLSPAEGPIPLGASLARRVLSEIATRGSTPLAILTKRRGGVGPLIPMLHAAATGLNVVGRTCNIDDFTSLVDSLSNHSPKAQREIAKELASHRMGEHISEIKVPTLVFAAANDPLCPEAAMRRLHESLHNSELVTLKGASHSCLLDLGPVIAARTRRFLEERRQQRLW